MVSNVIRFPFRQCLSCVAQDRNGAGVATLILFTLTESGDKDDLVAAWEENLCKKHRGDLAKERAK